MKIINLLPKDEQEQLRLDLVNHQLRTFWFIVVISLVIFGGIGLGTQQYLKYALKKVERDIVSTRAKLETADIRATQNQVLKLNENVTEIENIRSQQNKWSEVLLEIARITPDGVQMNSIQIERATGQVDLLGKALDRDTVIEMWANIKKSEMFYDVNFPLPNLEKPEDANFTYTFYIHMDKIKANELKD